MTWFTAYRKQWIYDIIYIYGFINREHLVKKFGISIPQASIDLREFMKEYPDLLIYDKSAKCYKLREDDI